MASLYDTSANSTFNEDKYINKLYDKALDSHKDAVQQGYDSSVKELVSAQQQTQNQTNDYVKRAYVEADRAAGNVQGASGAKGVGAGGANAQAALTMGNQQQRNVTALRDQQSAADQEYQRQRQLLADQYAAQIKQAQADNDMARAQALYEAAKAEEAQLRAFRQTGATMMAGKGDNSMVDAIARGDAVTRDTTSETWDGVLKNEEGINKIYDAQLESQRQGAQMAYNESRAQLEAAQQEAQRQTDRSLNDAYVDALKRNQNQQELQNAHGQSSGAAIRSRLAREAGLAGQLTDLRSVQLGRDAEAEQKKAELVHTLGQTMAKAQADTDRSRNQALYDAAEGEEQALVEEQQTIGQLLAKKNNYAALGKLYGLTQDQIDRLQGTGRYAPKKTNGGYKPYYRPEAEGKDDGVIGDTDSDNASINTNPMTQGSASQYPYSNNAGITAQLANAGKPYYSAGSTASSTAGINKSTLGKLVDIITEAAKKTHIGS